MLKKITYGCQISLSLCSENESYLSTDQLNDNLLVHKVTHQNEILNFDKCIFMIIPVLNHFWVGKLVELVKNDIDKEINKKESTIQSRQQTIKSYENNLDEEMMANISCFQKLQDTSLLFGTSTFHLIHKDSLRFVMINQESVQLVEFPSDYTVLHFQPVYQYQKQISCILDQETVTLCAAKSIQNRKCYLRLISKDQADQVSSTQNNPTYLKMNLYSSLQENEDLLYAGDLIAINLSETNLFLNAKQPYDTFHEIAEYQIQRLQNQLTSLTLTKIIYEDLKVTFDDVIERIGMKRIQKLQSSSYWKIEKTNGQGGQIQFYQLVRFKHNQSSRYLELLNGDPILTNQLSKHSLFILIPIDEGQKVLKKDSYFKIQHYQSGIYLEDQKNKQENRNINILRLRKIGEYEDTETKLLQYSVKIFIEAIELLQDINDQEIKCSEYDIKNKEGEIRLKIQFYFIYQKVKQILIYVSDFLMNKLISNLSPNQKYNQISFIRQDSFRQEPLFPLICLLFQMLKPELVDQISQNDKDYFEKEEKFYQITKTISRADRDEGRIMYYYTLQLKILQVQLIETINIICKDNIENQNCLFQFLPILHKHIILYPEFITILINLVCKNRFFLEDLSKIRKISSKKPNKNIFILEWLTEKVSLNSNAKTEIPFSQKTEILHLLATCCSFGVEAIFANQEMIFKTLINKKKNITLMKCIVDEEKNIIVTCNGKMGPVSIRFEAYFENTHKNSNPHFQEELNFLKAQFFLYSQLCLQRNYDSIKYFGDQFSDNSLVPLLNNNIIDPELRAHLIALCKNIYLDRDPLISQVKPTLIRVNINNSQTFFDNMFYEDEDGIFDKVELETKSLYYVIIQFKEILNSYLKQMVNNLNEQQPLKVYNLLTLQIMRILFMLLQFGWFSKQNDEMTKYRIDDSKEIEFVLERLIQQLSLLLEYDFDYQKAHSKLKQKNVNEKLAKIIQIQSLKFFRKREKKIINKNSIETIRDPLLRKLQNVKRVLNRFYNKTFSAQTNTSDYEIEIKIEICKIFQYLLDMRLDFMIDNAIAFFTNTFLPSVSKKFIHSEKQQLHDSADNKSNLQNHTVYYKKKYLTSLQGLLREDLLKPGQKKFQQRGIKDHVQINRIRHFDRIIDRPFIEVLLKGFYFANDHVLQNHIVELIERFQNQRSEFCNYLKQIQMIMTNNLQIIYRTMYILVQKLKNNVQNSQIWLRLDIPIALNEKNEETIEKVLEKLVEIYTIISKNEANEKSVRKIFLNCGGYQVVHQLIVKCLSVIDVNLDIFECSFELIDYDEQKQYQQELVEKILSIFQACLRLIGLSVRNDQQNQEFVLIKLARPLLRYNMVNLGQIELINELFSNNQNLLPLVNSNDLYQLLEYVKLYGKYQSFIELFTSIVRNKQCQSLYKDIYQALIQCESKDINPFQENFNFQKFYPNQPNIEEFRQSFLKIIEVVLIHDDRAALSVKMLEVLDFTDLTSYFLEKTQEMRNTNLDLELQDSITKIKFVICRIIFTLSKKKKKLLLIHENYFLQIISIEASWLEQQDYLQVSAKNYIVEALLPLINTYNEYANKKNSFKTDIIQIRSYALSVLKQYSQLTKNSDTQTKYQVHRLVKAFDMKLPDEKSESDSDQEGLMSDINGETFKTEKFEEYQITEGSDGSDQGCNDLELWEFFKKLFENNSKIKEWTETDQLAQSIWYVSDMFTNDFWQDKEKRELILTNDDILHKILAFLQFWKSNKASKQSAIFAIKLLIQIIKIDGNRIQILDQLGGTKVILTLIWEENESENDYIIQLLILIKGLLICKQVQKTTLTFLSLAISSDKFFQKMEMLLTIEQDQKICTLVLEIMELMCNDNNKELQNLIRYQKNNKKSYDLVQQTINYLCSLDIKNNYEQLIQCLKTLKSQAYACRPNQTLVANSKFVEFSIKVLNDSSLKSQLDDIQINQLKHQCLIILLVVAEINTKDDYIVQKLKKIVPKTVLIQHFVNVYHQMINYFGDDNYSKLIFENQPNFIMESGFNAYILYVILSELNYVVEDLEEFKKNEDEGQLVQDFLRDNILNELSRLGQSLMKHGLEQLNQIKQQFSGQVEEKMNIIKKHEMIHKAFQFYKLNTLQVEFVLDDVLYLTYFPKLPCFYLLRQEIKKKFLDQADRTSTKTKIISLVNFVDSAYKFMLHQESLRDYFKNHKFLEILARRGKLWMQLAFYNGFFINLIIILSYTQLAFPPGYKPKDPDVIQYYRLNEPRFLEDYNNTNTKYYLMILAYLNLAINFMVLFFYLIDKAPVKLQFVWNAWQASSLIGHMISGLIKVIISIIVLVIDFDIIYYILQIAFNIIGITIHPFFLAFHLIHILYLEPLIPILKAVWLAKFKFIGLWFTIVLFEYWVALISYVYFFEFFITDKNKNLCNHLWQCVYVTFDWTFKTDGSVGGRFMENIGEQAEEMYMNNLNNYYGRFFYDNIINIIIKLCIINVLLAVIIISYSELRSVQKQKEKDQNHKCFICGIDRLVFDKTSQNTGFWHHIKVEHNIWNYLFYMCYLRMKQSNFNNGVDNYIRAKQMASDYSWFPIRRAKALSVKLQMIESAKQKNTTSKSKLICMLHSLRRLVWIHKQF
ncbi:unnamed protein product [Paramecium pentaurelia]|uniref:RyR/IP3R Homology associated domain-containing protein n=1 Tax=Paramecium pentaurelia TaxID=43138 RepID=A0A8S1XK37_9CILI|nr:unnamed protein product [Paramecium pentaurelia]